jgi:hypothetical protein
MLISARQFVLLAGLGLLSTIGCVLAVPQQTTLVTALNSTVSANCVQCGEPPSCTGRCKEGQICSITVRTCEKCPEVKCLDANASLISPVAQETAGASEDSSTAPLIIAGVSVVLVLIAAVAGFVWYRQKRQNQNAAITRSVRSPMARMNKSDHRVSAGSSFSAVTHTDADLPSFPRPSSSRINVPSYHAAASATLSLAQFTESGSANTPMSQSTGGYLTPTDALRANQRFSAFTTASTNTSEQYTSRAMSISTNESPNTTSAHNSSMESNAVLTAISASLNPQRPTMQANQTSSYTAGSHDSVAVEAPVQINLGAMMGSGVGALMKDAVSSQSSIDPATVHQRHMSESSSAFRHSVADSTMSDSTTQSVVMAHRATIYSAHRATIVENVEDYLTPDGRISNYSSKATTPRMEAVDAQWSPNQFSKSSTANTQTAGNQPSMSSTTSYTTATRMADNITVRPGMSLGSAVQSLTSNNHTYTGAKTTNTLTSHEDGEEQDNTVNTVDVTLRLPDSIRRVLDAHGTSLEELMSDSPRSATSAQSKNSHTNTANGNPSAYW